MFIPYYSHSADCNATIRYFVMKNPVPCRTDGLLGDAHDTLHGLIFFTHFVEEMEENHSLATKSQTYFVPLHPKQKRENEERLQHLQRGTESGGPTAVQHGAWQGEDIPAGQGFRGGFRFMQ